MNNTCIGATLVPAQTPFFLSPFPDLASLILDLGSQLKAKDKLYIFIPDDGDTLLYLTLMRSMKMVER